MLHVIVFIFGFTGILGEEIQQDSGVIVFLRMLIASAGLVVWMTLLKPKAGKGFKWSWVTAGVGLIIAAHWITFFEAIKVSTVSVAVAIMASQAMFVAFFEPLIRKKRLAAYELVLGAVAAGALLIIFGFESRHSWGITLALISTGLAALFTVINSKLVEGKEPIHISVVELSTGMFATLCYLLVRDGAGFWPEEISGWDWMNLTILGLVATSFAFVVSVDVMKVVSPFTVALTLNLEPVYSIIIALLLYGEKEFMSAGFYLGTVLLIATVALNTIIKRRYPSAR